MINFILFLWSLDSIVQFTKYNTSQFGLAIFQVSNHMSLVATTLDSSAIGFKTSYFWFLS